VVVISSSWLPVFRFRREDEDAPWERTLRAESSEWRHLGEAADQ